MKFNILVGLWLAVAAACGGDDEAQVIGSKAEAEQRAETLLGGDATQTEQDGDLWEVEVAMPNGAKVTVELDADSGDLVEIEDKAGPFDYEIEPGMGFVSYGKARDAAVAKVGGERVVAWNLRAQTSPSDSDAKDEEGASTSGDFRYEFYVMAGTKLWEVKLDAKTSAVLDEEVKDKVD